MKLNHFQHVVRMKTSFLCMFPLFIYSRNVRFLGRMPATARQSNYFCHCLLLVERELKAKKQHIYPSSSILSCTTSILEVRATARFVVVAVVTAAEPTIIRDAVPCTVASIGQQPAIGSVPPDKL